MSRSPYDIAVICLNGHPITTTLTETPHEGVRFCGHCGEEGIAKCQKCNEVIRGESRDFYYNGPYEVKSYCVACGAAYPWIERRLAAADELADLIDELSDSEKEMLKLNFRDVVRDSPRNQVAAIKVKRLLDKSSPNFVSAVRDILINVISTPISNLIWGK